MKFFTYLIFVVIFTSSIRGWGQTPAPTAGQKYIITGIVSDAKKNTPLEYANVVIKNLNDSSAINGTYSGKSGDFILPNVSEGTYVVKVSYVGYEAKEIPNIIVNGASPKVDVGSVKLEQTAVQMAGVDVQGERAPEEFRLDKKVINVSQSLHASGGTALDALQNQPAVRIDADGNVTLRGSSNFTVLVNGRPSVFQGTDALKQIPSNIIDNIELITNPSAKYDAEGSAGIINIVTKTQTESTLNAILNAGTGSRNKYNSDATINYVTNPFTFTGGYDYRRTTFYQNQDIDRSSDLSLGEVFNQSMMHRTDTRNQYTIRLGVDYNPDDMNLLSLSGNGGTIDLTRDMNITIHNQSPVTNTYVFTTNGMDLMANLFNTVGYYKHKINTEGSELTAEGSYTNVWMPYDQLTREYQTDSTYWNRAPEPQSKKTSTRLQRNEGRVKINYSSNFTPQDKLECGLQSNFSHREMNFRNTLYSWSAQTWEIDPVLSNLYYYRNDVHAGFVTFSSAYLEFEYEIGFRAEYMDRLLTQKTLGADYRYTKLDWFPSASISRKLDTHQFQFSYSRRIDRPIDVFLNPFPYYSDTYLTSRGNPQLLPEYTNSFELNYQNTLSGVFLSAQSYYRASTGSMNQEIGVDSTGKMIAMFTNFANTGMAGIELTASATPYPWLRLDPNINFFDYQMDGTQGDVTIKSHDFTWTSRLTSTFILSPATRIMVTGNYQSRQQFPQGSTDPIFLLSLSARQDFFQRALSVTLQGQNILKNSKYNIVANGNNFRNSFVITPEIPIINLLVTYNFNNYKRPDRPTERVDVNVGM